MKRSSAFYSELVYILNNKKSLVSVIAVLLVPLLYCSMFLWAFWDPYAKMDVLPVAVINSDKGAVFEGEPMNVGKELADKLKESKDFDWRFVSRDQAIRGLSDRTYYMAIEIPSDFSERVTTVTERTPRPAEIGYIPNESYNFLAAQIGKTAVERIKENVSHNVTEAYTKTLMGSVKKLADGLDQAGEGAGKLADGSRDVRNGLQIVDSSVGQLASGAASLRDGLQKADSSTGKLSDGAHSLLQGIRSADAGAGELAQGAAPLKQGVDDLVQGASQLNAGLGGLNKGASGLAGGLDRLKQGSTGAIYGTDEVKAGADRLHDGLQASEQSLKQLEAGAQGVAEGLQGYAAAHPELQQDSQFSKLLQASQGVSKGMGEAVVGQSRLAEGAGQVAAGAAQLKQGLGTLETKLGEASTGAAALADGSSKLSDGGAKLSDGLNSLAAGADRLTAGLDRLKAGTGELAAGAEKLAGGMAELDAGTHKLAAGAGELAGGATRLDEGTSKLMAGADSLADGTDELSGKLQEAGGKAGQVNTGDNSVKMFAGPVDVAEQKYTEVPNYGTGFAPYFISLGAFVGALLLSIVFPLREPAAAPKSAFSWFLGKFAFISLVGVVQAVIVDAILLLGLGLHVQSVPLFFVFSIITSITFMALVQFLVTAFADAGRFIAVILLILQLTTSAGTFPVELLPDGLKPLHALLPMSYTVSGFKAVISSGDYHALWQSADILMLFAGSFALLTFGYLAFRFRQLKSSDSNQPAVSV